MAGIGAALVVAVVAGVLPTALYVLVLWWFDRYEKEPVWLLTLAFLWGAIPAVLFSLVAELVLHLPMAGLGEFAGGLIEASAVAPVIEEAVKGLALLGIFVLHRSEFDNVLDGIIYGAIVGFGFAMTENIFYYLGSMGEGGAAGLAALWLMRGLVFGLNHALFSAVTGAGLGLARLARSPWQRWLLPPLALLAAMTLHAMHNLFSALAEITCWSLVGSLVNDWGGLVVILIVMVLCLNQERRWLTTQLRSEVALGVISAEEYALYSSAWRRLLDYWQTFSRQGWAAARARSRRVAWATELAFKKQHLAMAGATAGEAKAIGKLRQLLRG